MNSSTQTPATFWRIYSPVARFLTLKNIYKQNIPELLKEIDKDILDQAVLQAQVTLEVQEMTGESGEEEPNENEE